MVAFAVLSCPQPNLRHVRLLSGASRTARPYSLLAGRTRRLREGRGGPRVEAARRACRGVSALHLGDPRAPADHATRHSRFLSQPEVRGDELARRLLAEIARAAVR